MKPVSSEKLRMMLQRLWSDLTMIWPTEPNYEIISLERLKKIVKACSVAHMVFIKGIWECDNYALRFHANVQKYQYDEFLKGFLKEYPAYTAMSDIRLAEKIHKTGYMEGKAKKTPDAIGEVMGMQFRGEELDHDINISVTDQGIYLIEPQTDEIWKADKTEDVPFFVKF